MCKECASVYGVKGDVLDYFDATRSLRPDNMYDMLERVLTLTMRLVICESHKQKHRTIQEINDELKLLCVGEKDEANKPLP